MFTKTVSSILQLDSEVFALLIEGGRHTVALTTGNDLGASLYWTFVPEREEVWSMVLLCEAKVMLCGGIIGQPVDQDLSGHQPYPQPNNSFLQETTDHEVIARPNATLRQYMNPFFQ